ncbi:MAG: tryptophan--tRNA ligase [Candidatus Omnitrophota bacterium]
MKKRVLSGMRPSGKLHLGHLLGALSSWIKMQDEYDCFFMVADWHALMSEYENPKRLSEYTLDTVVDWLSCGIDPQKAVVFVQSHVKEHLELNMILSCLTPLSWLERCPTYKEQLRELTGRELTTYGFLGYPVLQAADILVYRANSVPVGADQLHHLELAREIARRFNSLYKKDALIEPQPMLSKVSKLPGLDGRKMSKSYDNFIALSDSAEVIHKKVSMMFTDPKRIKLSDTGHPAACNIYAYFKIFNPDFAPEVEDYCRNAKLGCTQCKKKLADVLCEYLKDIQAKRRHLLEDKEKLYSLIEHGAQKASHVASETIRQIKDCVGLFK